MVQVKSPYWQKVVDDAQKHPAVPGLETIPFFTMAPMEAVTDSVFRRVVAKAGGPDVYFTEFTNARSITHPKAKFTVQGRLHVEESEQMPVAQLWGDRGIDFETACFDLKERGYEAVDINMGCPAPNVFKHGRGSGLILRPDVAVELIQAAKEGGLPVSVKTRLGHQDTEEYKEWLSLLLKQDIAKSPMTCLAHK